MLSAKAFVVAAVASLVAVVSFPVVVVSAAEFNGEIAFRVKERLRDSLSKPVSAVRLKVEYRSNGVFKHDLEGPDREHDLRINEVFRRVNPQGVYALYYGLENGYFLSTAFNRRVSLYREAGDSGYIVHQNASNPDPVSDVAELEAFRKHYRTCVDESGQAIPCDMSPGGPYIKCLDGCKLVRCPDEDSQRDCDGKSDGDNGGESGNDSPVLSEKEQEKCWSEVKWCRNYEKRIYEPQARHRQRGYVPRVVLCIDSAGIPSQTPGRVVPGNYARLPTPALAVNETSSPSSHNDSGGKGDGEERLGNCYYADRVTLVNRSLVGPYAYCGGNNNSENGEVDECNGTFVGAYAQHDFDPRWRGWYEVTKQSQKKNWSPPVSWSWLSGCVSLLGLLPFSMFVFCTVYSYLHQKAGVRQSGIPTFKRHGRLSLAKSASGKQMWTRKFVVANPRG